MQNLEPADPSGPRLRLIVGLISVVAVFLGVVGYWQLVKSRDHFAHASREMDAIGPTVDTEGCVSAVLAWHESCAANKPLCDNGVPLIMTHCLLGRDRSNYCEGLDMSSAKAQWVFDRCEDRGTPCGNRKNCGCASAYRSIDSFCRHGQEGVAL